MVSAPYVFQLAAQGTVNKANNTLQEITDALNSTSSIATNLSKALRVSQQVNSIRLPTPEYAMALADRILMNIVPDDLVAGIFADARASQATAEQALELARNARYRL